MSKNEKMKEKTKKEMLAEISEKRRLLAKSLNMGINQDFWSFFTEISFFVFSFNSLFLHIIMLYAEKLVALLCRK